MNDNERMKLIQGEVEESELTRDQTIGPFERPNRSKSVVYSVRLSESDVTALERLAQTLDLPVSTMVRGFVLEGLRNAQGDSIPTIVERVKADLDKLRSIVGR